MSDDKGSKGAGESAGAFSLNERPKAALECGAPAPPSYPDDQKRRQAPALQGSAEAEATAPRWRPASEPTCCGSDCADCPF